jgi:hypothetical protein
VDNLENRKQWIIAYWSFDDISLVSGGGIYKDHPILGLFVHYRFILLKNIEFF